ncbi:MAG: hypothetical protein HY823_10950 [Acidobacteria bacterium]|nr:hypothetical protein [Acidobacteriota bacterium]
MSGPLRKLFLVCLGLVMPLAAQVAPRDLQGPDNALARAAALTEWFGGRPTPAYLDFKAGMALREVERWGHLIPGTVAWHRRPLATPPNTWVNIGPTSGSGQGPVSGGVIQPTDAATSDSGRPTVILPHPTVANRLYMGVAGGGVWRCDNANPAAPGDWDWTWTPITDGLPAGTASGNLSVGGLAFKPEDPNSLYLALGDMEPGSADSTAEGRGFYTSTNGGNTWALGGALGSTTRVKTLLALAGNIVLVGGNDGLWRSTNGGASFTKMSLPASPQWVWDIVALSNGDLVLSAQNSSTAVGSIAYSTDSGASWTAATFGASVPFTPQRIALGATPASSTVLYGLTNVGAALQKGLLTSSNGGRTWAYTAAATLFNLGGDGDQGGYNHLIAVDPGDTAKIFAGSNLSLYRSTDSGATWTRLTSWNGSDRVYLHADFHVSAWAPASWGASSTLFIGTDGGLAVVRDPYRASVPTGSGGVASDLSFVDPRRNRGLATHLIYHLGSTTAASPADAKYRVTVGLQDQGSRYRKASTPTDGVYNLVNTGDGFGTLIHPSDGNKLLTTTYNTRVRRCTDGTTFTEVNTGIAEAGTNNAPFLTRLYPGPTDSTGDTVFTYTNWKVYRTTNWGQSWSQFGNTQSGYNIRGLAASPTAANTVATVNATDAAVAYPPGYLSTDGGGTWTGFGTPPGYLPPGTTSAIGIMSSVCFDPTVSTTLYATSVAFSATAKHLWKSTDSGGSWTALDTGSNGFPVGIPVHMVKVDPVDHLRVYACTDFGVYRSTDGGSNWTRFGSGLPLVSVRDIYISPDGLLLRIGTHGRGVWELSIPATPPPAITQQPANATVVAGANTSFTVAASDATSYQWQVNTGSGFSDLANGGVYSGATAATLSITGATQAMNGYQYRAVASGATAPPATSNAATLTVVWLSVTSGPANQAVNAGATATFSVTVDASPAPTFQWQVKPAGSATWSNVTTGSGGTTASYTTAATVPGDNGSQYRVVLQNTAGTLTSSAATLTVYWLAITTQPANQSVPFGAMATFTVVADANPAPTYQWQVKPAGSAAWANVGSGTGGNTAAYTTAPVFLPDNGNRYRVVLQNAAGTLTSSEALLTVLATFDLSFLDDLGRSKVCLNSTTGGYIWTELTGPGAGRSFWGLAITKSSALGILLSSLPGASARLSLTYEPAFKRARGSLTYGVAMSFLTDSDTTVPKTVPCP